MQRCGRVISHKHGNDLTDREGKNDIPFLIVADGTAVMSASGHKQTNGGITREVRSWG